MKNYIALGDLVLDIYHDNLMGLVGYYPGGSAWNDLINISKLDPNAGCFCVATCGNDWAGDFILHTLKNNRIDVSNVTRLNKQTKRFNIVVDSEKTRRPIRMSKLRGINMVYEFDICCRNTRKIFYVIKRVCNYR